MARIELLERIARIAEDIVYFATSLQPDQFNPETYEVDAESIDSLTVALSELSEFEDTQDDYVI